MASPLEELMIQYYEALKNERADDIPRIVLECAEALKQNYAGLPFDKVVRKLDDLKPDRSACDVMQLRNYKFIYALPEARIEVSQHFAEYSDEHPEVVNGMLGDFNLGLTALNSLIQLDQIDINHVPGLDDQEYDQTIDVVKNSFVSYIHNQLYLRGALQDFYHEQNALKEQLEERLELSQKSNGELVERRELMQTILGDDQHSGLKKLCSNLNDLLQQKGPIQKDDLTPIKGQLQELAKLQPSKVLSNYCQQRSDDFIFKLKFHFNRFFDFLKHKLGVGKLSTAGTFFYAGKASQQEAKKELDVLNKIKMN